MKKRKTPDKRTFSKGETQPSPKSKPEEQRPGIEKTPDNDPTPEIFQINPTPQGSNVLKKNWLIEGLDAKWTVALLAFIISGVNLFFYLRFNNKSNAILDYVALASFSIKPHSSVYKTMTEEEYDKTRWTENPDDLFGPNSHEWIFYYEVVDSDQNLIVIQRSPYYDIEKIRKSMDTFPWKNHRLGINKVFEPKFQITNAGQTPARAFEFKIGVKQSSKPSNYWTSMTTKLPPMQLAAHEDLYPLLTLVIPYPERMTDSMFFRIRIHYRNIFNTQTDTNYYLIWYPPMDGWYKDGDIHLRFQNQQFQDEIKN